MKNIFIILFAFLISCSNSPENKIKRSFENERFARRGDIHIKNVEIYDTIVLNDVINMLNSFDKKSEELQMKLSKFDHYRDSIKISVYSHIKRDSLFRSIDHIQGFYEREFDMTMRQQLDYANLGKQVDDSIYAYKVRITTDKRSFDFLVSPLTYTIIAPIFPKMPDSLRNFNKF